MPENGAGIRGIQEMLGHADLSTTQVYTPSRSIDSKAVHTETDPAGRASSEEVDCTMALAFEWDPEKADANRKKHGVSFEEALTAFADPLHAVLPDPRHSSSEQRFVLFGHSDRGRLPAVMHTDRGDRIRLISARETTRRERKQYARGDFRTHGGG